MPTTYSEKSVLELETTGFVVEAAAGVAVVVLAIIGLAQGDTGFITSIACIVLGAAMLALGGTIAAEYSKLLSSVSEGVMGNIELGGGMTVELLAGAATVVLGILALIGFAAESLLAIAIMVVGASLMLSAGGLQRLNNLKMEAAGVADLAQRVAKATVSGAIGAQALAGGAALVLGILALSLAGNGAVLTLVGFLVLGAAVTVSGTALTGRLLKLFTSK